MKRILAIALLSIILIASAPMDTIPSALPAVYYGSVTSPGAAGLTLEVKVGGAVVASTVIYLMNGGAAYLVAVPMYSLPNGTPAEVYVAGALAFVTTLQGGVNTQKTIRAGLLVLPPP